MTERGGYYFDVVAWRNSDRVRLMDFETRSAYREVMDEIWITGSIPDDPGAVSRLLQIPQEVLLRVWPVIKECLIPTPKDPSRWTSERMEVERKKRNEIRKKRKKAAQLGGKITQERKRENLKLAETITDNTQANAKQMVGHGAKQNQAVIQEQVLEQVLIQKKKRQRPAKAAAEYSPEFLAFWESSTKRGGKFEAWREWQTLSPDLELQRRILDKMAEARSSPDWTECAPQYLPHVRTWLHSRGWENEYRKSNRLPMPPRPVPVC